MRYFEPALNMYELEDDFLRRFGLVERDIRRVSGKHIGIMYEAWSGDGYRAWNTVDHFVAPENFSRHYFAEDANREFSRKIVNRLMDEGQMCWHISIHVAEYDPAGITDWNPNDLDDEESDQLYLEIFDALLIEQENYWYPDGESADIFPDFNIIVGR